MDMAKEISTFIVCNGPSILEIISELFNKQNPSEIKRFRIINKSGQEEDIWFRIKGVEGTENVCREIPEEFIISGIAVISDGKYNINASIKFNWVKKTGEMTIKE